MGEIEIRFAQQAEQRIFFSFLLCSNLIVVWQDVLCSGEKWTRLPEQ